VERYEIHIKTFKSRFYSRKIVTFKILLVCLVSGTLLKVVLGLRGGCSLAWPP